MRTPTDPARHRAAGSSQIPLTDLPAPVGRLSAAGRRSATSVVVTGLVVSMFGAPASAAPPRPSSAAVDSTESRAIAVTADDTRSLAYSSPWSSVSAGAPWSFDVPAVSIVADPPPAPPADEPSSAEQTPADSTPADESSAGESVEAASAAEFDAEELDADAFGAQSLDDASLGAAVAEAQALDAAASTAAAGTRVAALQPFSVTAPANTSFGSGAKFEGSTATKTKALLNGNPNLNADKWSIAVAIAKSTDPVATIKNIKTGVTTSFRVPSGAQVTAGTDKHMTVVQPDGYTAYECYKMTKVGTNSWTTTYLIKTDLRTNGLAAGARASGISQVMGLIRVAEVKAKKIPHTLAIGIPDSMLKSGQVWPARLQDSNAATAYKGPIPMGTMMGIPPSVDLSKLGLTPEGLALGKALQDYGAHVLVRASTVALFAEPASDAAAVYRMRQDWKAKLYPLMRVVTNNTPSTVAGGGVRRQPAAAALTS